MAKYLYVIRGGTNEDKEEIEDQLEGDTGILSYRKGICLDVLDITRAEQIIIQSENPSSGIDILNQALHDLKENGYGVMLLPLSTSISIIE